MLTSGADGVFLEDSLAERSASGEELDDSLIQEQELVAALIRSVWKTLKIEDAPCFSTAHPVQFGTPHPKRSTKVFPYIPFFEEFLYRQWKHLL